MAYRYDVFICLSQTSPQDMQSQLFADLLTGAGFCRMLFGYCAASAADELARPPICSLRDHFLKIAACLQPTRSHTLAGNIQACSCTHLGVRPYVHLVLQVRWRRHRYFILSALSAFSLFELSDLLLRQVLNSFQNPLPVKIWQKCTMTCGFS